MQYRLDRCALRQMIVSGSEHGFRFQRRDVFSNARRQLLYLLRFWCLRLSSEKYAMLFVFYACIVDLRIKRCCKLSPVYVSAPSVPCVYRAICLARWPLPCIMGGWLYNGRIIPLKLRRPDRRPHKV
jgi:hypothetical protein